jgi:hypothetical protein
VYVAVVVISSEEEVAGLVVDVCGSLKLFKMSFSDGGMLFVEILVNAETWDESVGL